MRIFRYLEVDEAKSYALNGGQALHLHKIVFDNSPLCFRRAVERGEYIAHLFDQDRARLIATARRLGVKVIFVDKDGSDRQHIDLCGAPLKKAMQLAEAEGLFS